MKTNKTKRSRVNLLVGLFVAALLAGCASTVPTKDITVDSASDPKANFSGYRTYAWLGSALIVNDPAGQWEPIGFDADSEIKYLIDRELRKRGMSETTSNPDLVVMFAAGVDMEAFELKVEPKTKIESLVNAPAGGLVVALADAETGYTIWTGLAVADIHATPDAAIAKARLDYAVSKLFKLLPK